MFLVVDTFVAQDSAGGIGRLRSFHHPVERFFAVYIDGGGFRHGVVRAEALNIASIAGRAGIRYDNLVERVLLAAHSLQSDFYRHLFENFNLTIPAYFDKQTAGFRRGAKVKRKKEIFQ